MSCIEETKPHLDDESRFSGSARDRLVIDLSIRGLLFYKMVKYMFTNRNRKAKEINYF